MSAVDPIQRALARRGEVRGSAAEALKNAIAGKAPQPKPKLAWYEVAERLKALNDEIERQQQAQREAAANPPPPPKSVAQQLQSAIGGGASSGVVPLNTAALLRAAIQGLGAEGGTINGTTDA